MERLPMKLSAINKVPSSYPRSSSLPPSYKRPSDKDVSELYPEEN